MFVVSHSWIWHQKTAVLETTLMIFAVISESCYTTFAEAKVVELLSHTKGPSSKPIPVQVNKRPMKFPHRSIEDLVKPMWIEDDSVQSYYLSNIVQPNIILFNSWCKYSCIIRREF